MASPEDGKTAIMNAIATDLGIIRRGAWGAQSPARPLEPDWNYNAIVVHNTGHGHIDTMVKIQKFDLAQRGWDDVAYHYGIMPDGTMFEGRQLIYKGGDVKNQNTGKIGIVCIGDFDSSVINWVYGKPYGGDPVLQTMLASLRKLTVRLAQAFRIIYFGGHIEYGDTNDCPGSSMLPYMAQFRADLNFSTPVKRSGL